MNKKSLVTEFYKTIKLVTNSIIVTCAALILIGLPTIEDVNIYQEAVEEIVAIKKACREIIEYETSFVEKRYGEQISIIKNTFDELPLSLMRRYGNSPLSPNYSIGSAYSHLVQGQVWRFSNLSLPRFNYNLESTIDTTKLRQLYLDTKRTLRVDRWSFSECRKSKVHILFFKNGEEFNSNDYFELRCSGSILNSTSINEIRDNEKNILKKHNILSDSLEINVFPRLRHPRIWESIENLNFNEAEITLREKAKEKNESKSKSLSIFGFSIPSLYAAVIGPIVLMSLLLFLLIHLRALNKELENVKERKERVAYPWIGIYKDKWSSIMFLFLIVVLPLVACGLIIYASNLCILLKLISGALFFSIIGYTGYEIINTTKAIKSSYF